MEMADFAPAKLELDAAEAVRRFARPGHSATAARMVSWGDDQNKDRHDVGTRKGRCQGCGCRSQVSDLVSGRRS